MATDPMSNVREYLQIPSPSGLHPPCSPPQRRHSAYSRSSFKGSSVKGPTTGKMQQQQANTRMYEHTYQLEPKENHHFSVPSIERVIRQVLDAAQLENRTYDVEKTGRLAKTIAQDLKDNCKKLRMDRYKLMSQVVIGQNLDQGVSMTSRSLWDTSTDSFATVTVKKGSLIVTAMVFGVYFE